MSVSKAALKILLAMLITAAVGCRLEPIPPSDFPLAAADSSTATAVGDSSVVATGRRQANARVMDVP